MLSSSVPQKNRSIDRFQFVGFFKIDLRNARRSVNICFSLMPKQSKLRTGWRLAIFMCCKHYSNSADWDWRWIAIRQQAQPALDACARSTLKISIFRFRNCALLFDVIKPYHKQKSMSVFRRASKPNVRAHIRRAMTWIEFDARAKTHQTT